MKWVSRWQRSYEWHPWFAWHPVTIGGVSFWLETIERRRVNKGRIVPMMPPTFWEYRERDHG